MNVLERTTRAGRGEGEVGAETCGLRSEAAWLEINRRVQFASSHAYIPLGAKCQRTWRGERDTGIFPKSQNHPFSFGGGLFVQLAGFTFTKETTHSPPIKKSPEHVPSHHTF